MASSPASVAAGPTLSGTRIGRPPQWTISRSRKLARLYLYSTLSIERIIRVLEDDGFSPRYGFGFGALLATQAATDSHQEELGSKDHS
jgi:hypothetical protein